jgi:hypothetical protein
MKRDVRSKAPAPAKDTITAVTTYDKIIAVLWRIDSATDAALIEAHARLIDQVWLDLMVSYRSRGFDIGVDNDNIAYARPRSKTAGLARELGDLAPKCRKAVRGRISLREWTTIWAAQPHRIRKLWKPKLIKTAEGRTIDRSTIAMSFVADGFVMVVPKPEIVLPMIEAALAQITAKPRSQKHERNEAEAMAIAAVSNVYREITGNTRKRVYREGKGAVGARIQFGREIDRIFGTQVFAAKDSVRFR